MYENEIKNMIWSAPPPPANKTTSGLGKLSSAFAGFSFHHSDGAKSANQASSTTMTTNAGKDNTESILEKSPFKLFSNPPLKQVNLLNF